jgi:hypothetical protein
MFANEQHLSIMLLGMTFGDRVSERYDNRDSNDSDQPMTHNASPQLFSDFVPLQERVRNGFESLGTNRKSRICS